jgi:cell division protein FtsN
MAKPRRTTSQGKQSKQTGGTFIGIVLGLIVGLAIAVIVALYITRAPTPFVAKVAPPPSDNSASQSSSSAQPYDPNRPLQGKTPGQAVPQAAQPTPPNTAPGQSSNQSQSSGMLDEPQIVEVPPSGNAASESKNTAKNQASAPAATSSANASAPKNGSQPNATAKTNPPAPGDVNTGYYLQVGAYKTQQDAEQQRARLGFQGFESKVTQRDAGGVTSYRVRVGPFAKFEEMNTARQRLSDAGVDTAVIRFSKQ